MVMMLDIGCGYRVKAIPNCFQGLRVALATTKMWNLRDQTGKSRPVSHSSP